MIFFVFYINRTGMQWYETCTHCMHHLLVFLENVIIVSLSHFIIMIVNWIGKNKLTTRVLQWFLHSLQTQNTDINYRLFVCFVCEIKKTKNQKKINECMVVCSSSINNIFLFLCIKLEVYNNNKKKTSLSNHIQAICIIRSN